ncbi:uncharacterized protein BCR38DRAFT_333623 [Pseudomassariella vexata]|uniref:WHIM1 domain-containing protein n=1 Tax=Pseudomassariella vexata TaxID=1141098 RepID=A0A1Y2EEH4_9PEZI|nr:uncharacterized protein BCR38DRAFT_333623 [Pseudomassariella vexata]ORY69972.1 hypothetical protein BCR38DRAFT_333623 [Pseudomassariella vexata]
MADDESSELSSVSSLSDAPPSEDEGGIELKKEKGILKFFHKVKPGQATEKKTKPETPARPPSPDHEYILADNPDIAQFLTMFRSRFHDAFPKSMPSFGPQELERDVTEPVVGQRAEHFLCAILGLLLNRKNDVKPGHYNRALEDAISTHKSQWPKEWKEKSPLSGGGSFAAMDPTERLRLLRTLVLWTLSSSEVVKGIINQSYKQTRHDDDLNQPLSVQPWGSDSDKRRYFLIEGLDDTSFRVYRESNPVGFNRTWWSVAGSIEELNALSDKLISLDGGPKAKRLAQQMMLAVPRFEATEEKRRRREYRQQQKERFKRPEPGFSMYEGRTRGKRMKYTYSEDEDFLSDSTGVRRSTRNTGSNTPAEPAGPVTTASGRQIKAPSRMTVDASNNIVTTSPERDEEAKATSKESSLGPTGRPRRSAAVNHGTNGWASTRTRGYNSMDDEDESPSEPDLGDDEEEEHVPDDSNEEEEFDEEMADEDDLGDAPLNDNPKSMVVKLKVPSKEAQERNGSKVNFDKFRYNGSDSKTDKAAASEAMNDEKTEESISVAPRKRATPDSTVQTSRGSFGSTERLPPPTPASNSLHSTSLAYRESPDKLQAKPVSRVEAEE